MTWPLEVLVRVVAFAVGLAVAAFTVVSAVKTLVLPRGARDPLTTTVFIAVRRLFRLRPRWASGSEERDEVMALFAPMGLLVLPCVWLILVLLGYMGMYWAYMGMYWAIGVQGARADFTLSGSSLLTLGFAAAADLPTTMLALWSLAVAPSKLLVCPSFPRGIHTPSGSVHTLPTRAFS